jgi:HK97 family phage portal protein
VSIWWRAQPAPPGERRGPEIAGWPSVPGVGLGERNYSTVDASRGITALQSVAVRASCDLICSLVSELPVDVFSGSGATQAKKPTPSYLLDPGGDGYGLEDWISQVLISWLLRGNLFGDIVEKAPSGFPTTITIWNPDQVGGYLDNDGKIQWSFAGQRVDNPDDMLHRRVNALPGQILGLSPIASNAAMIGLNITGTRFGLQWFQDGAHPSGMLVNAEVEMTKPVAKTAKERFMAAVRGTREPVVFGKGWSYQQLQIAPEESQFLETQRFSSAECARMFGPGMAEILGYETGGSLTYVTVEGKSVHLSVYTLNKWMRRIERLLSSMLPRGQYAKLNRRALLETTTLDRYGAHQIALRNRWTTVNEVRDIEDQPPVPWGNEPNELAPSPAAEKVPTVD